ncbi:MAG: MEDS domain-containing protein [Candidatus Binataceae bacterium]
MTEAPKSSAIFNRARATRSDIAKLHQSGEVGHFVHFYEDDRFVLENIARLASIRVAAGDSGIFVATPPHLDTIEQALAASHLNLKALRAQGRHVTHDADATLARFMEDGWPNQEKFFDSVGGIVSQAILGSSNRSVLIFGEMVAQLCARDNSAAAIRLEHLWNLLSEQYRFALWCAYPLSIFQNDAGAEAMHQICAEHSLVVPAESPL